MRAMRTRWSRAVGGVVLATAVVLAAAPAGAQDPYGGTTTTAPTGTAEASCSLAVGQAAPGATVTATVSGVPFGDTVRILFGGIEAGRSTAAGTAGQPGVTVLQVPFVVPDVSGGSYLVVAVGSAFTATCDADFQVLGASVLGSTVERLPGAGTGSKGPGSLAKTGASLAALVALAVALLLSGRALVSASRERAGVDGTASGDLAAARRE